MSQDGEVSRNIVIDILKTCGVSVSEQPKDSYVLELGDVLEVINLPQEVCRRRLHELQRKFRVPIHFFYNPQMASEKKRTGQTPLKKKAAN